MLGQTLNNMIMIGKILKLLSFGHFKIIVQKFCQEISHSYHFKRVISLQCIDRSTNSGLSYMLTMSATVPEAVKKTKSSDCPRETSACEKNRR